MDNFSLQVAFSRRTSLLRLRMISATIGAFLGIAAFWWFIPFETRVAASEKILDAAEQLHDEAIRVPDDEVMRDKEDLI